MSQERLYASIDGRVNPLANQEVVFHDPVRDQTHPMTHQVLQAMDLCRPFRTLDGHVAALAGALQGLAGQEQAIRRVLESLVSRGLLVSDEVWLEQIARGGHAEPAPLAAVFIRAEGGLDRLRVLLDDLLDYERGFAPGHRYVLLDAADVSAESDERRRLLAEFAVAAEVRANYIDSSIRAKLAAALHRRAGVSAAGLVDAASPGAARNLAAVLSAGRRHVMLEDAGGFRVHRHGEPHRGLDPGPRSRTQLDFPDTVDAALAAGMAVDDDPLQWPLAICGARLGSLLNRVQGFELGREGLAGFEPSRAPHLRADTRVLAVAAGIRGGASAGPWQLLLDGEARARVPADRNAYLRWLARPALVRTTRCVQLDATGPMQPLVVDNSHPVACAPPSGRDHDPLFAALWRAMYPVAVSAELPVTLGALSAATGTDWLKQPISRSGNAFLGDLTARLGSEIRAARPDSRLATLACAFRDLAAASDTDLHGDLREYHAFARSSLVQSLQRAFEEAGADAPLHWQADVRQLVEVQGRALIDGGDPRLADVGGGAVEGLRGILEARAADLDTWPLLWRAAREHADELWKLI